MIWSVLVYACFLLLCCFSEISKDEDKQSRQILMFLAMWQNKKLISSQL